MINPKMSSAHLCKLRNKHCDGWELLLLFFLG
jgi:hypothetical protein